MLRPGFSLTNYSIISVIGHMAQFCPSVLGALWNAGQELGGFGNSSQYCLKGLSQPLPHGNEGQTQDSPRLLLVCPPDHYECCGGVKLLFRTLFFFF